MAIAVSMSATCYAQTALLFIAYDLDGYSRSTVSFDLRVARPDIWHTSGTNQAWQRYDFILQNNGDEGSITVPIYPLPANTTINIRLYLREPSGFSFITETNITTAQISTNAVYEVIPAVTASSEAGFPRLLSETDKQTNARIFFNALNPTGWSDSAIASILAFAEHYGDINAAINMKYLMPWALDRKPYDPWTYYFGGDTYFINDYGTGFRGNMDQFGRYNGSSGDNNEFLIPQTSTSSTYYGGALNAFLQRNAGINCRPSDNFTQIGGCLAFLPVHKQHYLDIFERYGSYAWYATNEAFTVEQYIQYLKYVKDNRETSLELIVQPAELQDFDDFTHKEDEPEVLVMKLYRSLNNYQFRPGSLCGYVSQWAKDIDNAETWLPRYARKWYDYIQTIKPHPHKKRKGMPVWEMLRYTI